MESQMKKSTTINTTIQELIMFYIKENYKNYIKENNIDKIQENQIKKVITTLYTEK